MGTNYKHWIGRLLGSSLRWPEGEIGIISGKLGFRLRCKALATYNHPTNQSILWDVTKCNVSCLLSFHQWEVYSDSDEKKCWFISESDASSGLINVFILPICFCTKNLSYFSDPGEFWKFSPVSSLFPGMVTKTSQSLFSQKSRFQPTPNPLSSVPQKIFTNSFSSLKDIVVFVKARTQGVPLWDSHRWPLPSKS